MPLSLASSRVTFCCVLCFADCCGYANHDHVLTNPLKLGFSFFWKDDRWKESRVDSWSMYVKVRCDCQLCSLSPSCPPSSPPLPSPLPFIHMDQDPPSYAAKFPPCKPWTTMNRNASLLSSAHHRLHCSSLLMCAPPLAGIGK